MSLRGAPSSNFNDADDIAQRESPTGCCSSHTWLTPEFCFSVRRPPPLHHSSSSAESLPSMSVLLLVEAMNHTCNQTPRQFDWSHLLLLYVKAPCVSGRLNEKVVGLQFFGVLCIWTSQFWLALSPNTRPPHSCFYATLMQPLHQRTKRWQQLCESQTEVWITAGHVRWHSVGGVELLRDHASGVKPKRTTWCCAASRGTN